jgi:hypothetical protein
MIKKVKQIKKEIKTERELFHYCVNQAIEYLIRPKDFLDVPDSDFIVIYKNRFFISGYDEKEYKFMKGVRKALESDPDLKCKLHYEQDEFGEECYDLEVRLK